MGFIALKPEAVRLKLIEFVYVLVYNELRRIFRLSHDKLTNYGDMPVVYMCVRYAVNELARLESAVTERKAQ